MKLFYMAANKLFGILLVMVIVMVHLNMADEKSYSKSSANVKKNIIEGALPMEKDLRAKTNLHVALFPFLPDLENDNHKNLLKYIKGQFEQLHPDVHVSFRAMNTSDNFYDTKVVTEWLEGPGDIHDVVEIDTVILGDLVDAGVVAPQYLSSRFPPADWHPAATSGVTVNSEIYAYPHLLCAILLFTRNETVAAAVTIDDLYRAVKAAEPTYYHMLIGNLNSSWDVTALYLDSYRESNIPYNDLYGSLEYFSDRSLESLHKIAQLCNYVMYENYCLDGRFRLKSDGPSMIFGTRSATALYGYSEQLHYILHWAKKTGYFNNNDIKIKPLPLGDIANEPLFFTDAFVFRRGMSTDKLMAARNFVEFMGTPKMQAAVAAMEETALIPKTNRYLLPMSNKAYTVPPLDTDYFYQTYFRNLTGRNLPNRGMSKLRDIAKKAMYFYLNRPI